MSRGIIFRIREKVRLRSVTRQPMPWMKWPKTLKKQAILNGKIVRIGRDDPRGTRYVIEGIGVDRSTPVAVGGRFTNTNRYLIIPVYEVSEQ